MPWALEVFCYYRFQRLVIKCQIGYDLLQASVLVFKLPESLYLAEAHAAVFCFPVVIGGVAESVLAAEVADLYSGIGYGKFAARQVLARAAGEPLGEKRAAEPPRLASAVKRILGMHESAILVRGQDDVLVYRASCCNPIPGDEITGYITRGRGVAVHHASCPNVQNLLYETERRIPVEWAPKSGGTYSVRLRVYTEDKPGILAAITAAISEAEANIRSLESSSDDLRARIEILLDLADHKQLDRIVASIRRVAGIFDVERVYNV